MSGRPVAIVTGSSSGIGRATALALARRGHPVGLVARRSDRLAQVAAEIRAAGGVAAVAVADVGDRDACAGAVAEIREALGPVGVLINNAGMPGGEPFTSIDVAAVERVMRVNFLGAVWCTRAVLPDMLAARAGAIVSVASVAGRVGVPRAGAYVATKHALVGWSEALRTELEPAGIRVGVVNPGPVRTESWPHAGVSERLVASTEQVARAVLRCVDGRRAEVTVPWFYGAAGLLRAVAPGVARIALARSSR